MAMKMTKRKLTKICSPGVCSDIVGKSGSHSYASYCTCPTEKGHYTRPHYKVPKRTKGQLGNRYENKQIKPQCQSLCLSNGCFLMEQGTETAALPQQHHFSVFLLSVCLTWSTYWLYLFSISAWKALFHLLNSFLLSGSFVSFSDEISSQPRWISKRYCSTQSSWEYNRMWRHLFKWLYRVLRAQLRVHH